MYLIGEFSKKMGIAPHTIRFYEKMGLIPSSDRINGKDRIYSEKDIQFIQFLLSLKETGMSLKDIKELVDLGCLLDQNSKEQILTVNLRKEILTKHLLNLKAKKKKIEEVIYLTNQKLHYYESISTESSTKEKK
ncbi:MerR family transcriptional regulator [Cytobacillus suaedae]|nr:MerR family transcriptional regulator [Cytobacillus suaedae]